MPTVYTIAFDASHDPIQIDTPAVMLGPEVDRSELWKAMEDHGGRGYAEVRDGEIEIHD